MRRRDSIGKSGNVQPSASRIEDTWYLALKELDQLCGTSDVQVDTHPFTCKRTCAFPNLVEELRRQCSAGPNAVKQIDIKTVFLRSMLLRSALYNARQRLVDIAQRGGRVSGPARTYGIAPWRSIRTNLSEDSVEGLESQTRS